MKRNSDIKPQYFTRFMCKTLALLCIVPTLALPLSAQSYGIIGSVLTTDIKAYINGYEIPAYNVDGNMVIVGSDLRNYGFNVVYDNNTRTSSVSMNPYGTWSPLDTASYSTSSIGVKVMDVYDTDISVLLNGIPVTSYNVNGSMAFKFSELKMFGSYYYDNASRTTNLQVDTNANFQAPSISTPPSQQSGKYQATVEVSDSHELLQNIGSNKKIILTSDYYNLFDYSEINNPHVAEQDYHMRSYVIKDVTNLTITGNADIVIDDIYADVLLFENCSQITLEGLTIGHTEGKDYYVCEGAVTRFNNCDDVILKNCNLFGCGAFGIYADGVSNLYVNNCDIYDCTYTGIWLTDNSTAIVENTEFYNSVHTSGFIRIDNSTIDCQNCNIHDIVCNDFGAFIDIFDFYDTPSVVRLTNCTFTNNTFDTISNAETAAITFENCTFKNNIGDMEHPSVVYKNTTINSMSGFPQTNPSSPAYSVGGDYLNDNIKILRVYANVNSAGGAEPEIIWRNDSGKTIKYIYFRAVPYNAVGDSVSCRISGDTYARLKATGPYEPFNSNAIGFSAYFYYDGWCQPVFGGYTDGAYVYIGSTDKYYLTAEDYNYIFDNETSWDAVWYNNSIQSIKITEIEVIYMDGSSETILNPPLWTSLLGNAGK